MDERVHPPSSSGDGPAPSVNYGAALEDLQGPTPGRIMAERQRRGFEFDCPMRGAHFFDTGTKDVGKRIQHIPHFARTFQDFQEQLESSYCRFQSCSAAHGSNSVTL